MSLITVLDTRQDDVLAALRRRSISRDADLETTVASTIEDVRQRGDAALLDSARKYDAPDLASIHVTEAEIAQAQVPQIVAAALEQAIRQVQAFHARQLAVLTEGWRAMPFQSAEERRLDGQPLHVSANFEYRWHRDPGSQTGGGLGQRWLPLRSAGVYVPGGQATYPSSVVMNVIPAQCAGVNAVLVATPARKDGALSPAVLAALGYCGVAKAIKVGGAAAVAGLALGTESIPRVDKVVGPGNRFVNEAKRQLWGQVGLDGYAGPSEVCVLADESANPRFAAADFLTQIEHAEDNAGFLVCTDEAKLSEILAEIDRQATGARRESVMRKALGYESLAILVQDLAEACEVVDAIAPEHLSIATQNPELAMSKIRNAGCVLLGEWSPESAGDYAAGPSHTLPTAGAARFGAPVNVLDFLKIQSVVRLSRDDLAALRPTIETLAEVEGFPTHGAGSAIRFEEA